MYKLKPGIKNDPVRRWALPDRIFFGHGACHILAGSYLRNPPLPGFYAERIIPMDDLAGNHIFFTDDVIAFDYHGYSGRQRLLTHHEKCWASQYDNWGYTLEAVKFDLLSTAELNARKMLGPDQYLHNPIIRAEEFIRRFDHRSSFAGATDKLTRSLR